MDSAVDAASMRCPTVMLVGTFFCVLVIEVLPLLHEDLELLEHEAVGESVPAGPELHEVVFMGGVFLHLAVDVDTLPA